MADYFGPFFHLTLIFPLHKPATLPAIQATSNSVVRVSNTLNYYILIYIVNRTIVLPIQATRFLFTVKPNQSVHFIVLQPRYSPILPQDHLLLKQPAVHIPKKHSPNE